MGQGESAQDRNEGTAQIPAEIYCKPPSFCSIEDTTSLIIRSYVDDGMAKRTHVILVIR